MERIKIIIGLLLFSFCLQAQPNIIYIMADDLGNGEIGSNNSDFYTPHIDSLRAKGAYFSQFYVQPICTPTRAALTSGMYPHRYSFQIDALGVGDEDYLPDSIPTLAERLKDNGYATAHIGKWHIGHNVPEALPHVRGFDYDFGNYYGRLDYNFPYLTNGDVFDVHENGVNAVPGQTQYYTELLGSKAVAWVEKAARCTEAPFFLQIDFTAPHEPIEAPADTISLAPGSMTTEEKTRYAMIRIMDNEIGKIWDAVVNAGVENNTVIIFTSDNGADENYSGNNDPYTNDKGNLGEGGIRVPFIWYQPGTVSRGTQVDSACHIVDLMPTFISLAGGTLADSYNLDGVDISGLTTGSSIASRYILHHIIPNRTWAITKGCYKLVNNKSLVARSYLGSAADNIELFNVCTDAAEATDISGTYPALVNELQAVIDNEIATRVNTGLTFRDFNPPTGVVDSLLSDPKTFYNPSYEFYKGN